MQVAGANEVLAHNASDESLVQDLKQLVVAPDEVISRMVCARTKNDRFQIHHILGHLPAVRTARADRQAIGAGSGPARIPATPGALPPGGASRDAVGTPRVACTPRGTAALAGSALMSTQTSAGPAAAAPALTRRGADGRCAFTTTVARKAWRDESTQQQAEKRIAERLAEIGCDPTATAATEALQTLYARDSHTAYWFMNREAEKRLRVRPHTPQSFTGMLSPQAHKEVRRARDLPVTDTRDALDSSEVDTLADVCRSLRHFDETGRGYRSEYKRSYAAHPPASRRLGATA
mmetsp:Transcript_102685/g.290385  ORF Transcript_102685/g.290385 Transcript_102685/m.290385 type:complete len:292 (+) Transcript_102685:11-886(+)